MSRWKLSLLPSVVPLALLRSTSSSCRLRIVSTESARCSWFSRAHRSRCHQQLAPFVIIEIFPRHTVSEHAVERTSFTMLAREAEAEWNSISSFTSEMWTCSPSHAVAIEEDFAVGHRCSQS